MVIIRTGFKHTEAKTHAWAGKKETGSPHKKDIQPHITPRFSSVLGSLASYYARLWPETVLSTY